MPENLRLLPPHQLARGALGEAPQQCCRLWQMLPETPRDRAQGEHLHPPHHPWEPWVVAVGGCLYPQGRAAEQGMAARERRVQELEAELRALGVGTDDDPDDEEEGEKEDDERQDEGEEADDDN